MIKIKLYFFLLLSSSLLCNKLYSQSSLLTIPNIFTPNNDDQNDAFTLQINTISEVDGKVFNRWGELMSAVKLQVSQTDNEVTLWDGTNQSGVAVPSGIYYYIITAKKTDGVEINQNGFIQLTR